VLARRSLLTMLALALLVPACTEEESPGDGSQTPTQTQPPSESPTATDTATSSPTPEPAPVLEDGRHYVFIKTIKTGTDPKVIRFDLAAFLTGDEANEAAVEDGVIEPGDSVPNDYYVVNDNPMLRKLPLADDVKVLIVNWDSCCDSIVGELDEVAEAFKTGATEGLYRSISGFWITVKGGIVTKLEEQFVP